MHYYQFNIKDYLSHTAHLDPLEDLAYRRMLEWCYLHEKSLPKDVERIAKLIRMQTHCTCIAYILQEFFIEHSDGWINNRVLRDLGAYHKGKDDKKRAADARWANKPKAKEPENKGVDADAMQVQSKCNANHKPLTINHKPLTINQVKEIRGKSSRFVPPTLTQVHEYCHSRLNEVDAGRFIDFYTTKGWMVGKNKMKDWKAAVRNWERGNSKQQQPGMNTNTQGIQDWLNEGNDK